MEVFSNRLAEQELTVGDLSLGGEQLEHEVERWRTRLTHAFSIGNSDGYPILLLDNSLQSHLIVLALARGHISCALVDASLPPERVKAIMTQQENSRIFASAENPWLEGYRQDGIEITHVDDKAVSELSPASPTKDGEVVVFTSGTTGRPKGVVLAWSTIETWVSWRADLVAQHCDQYVNLGFFPTASAAGVLLCCDIYSGASTVSLEARNFYPFQLLAEIAHFQPTVLHSQTQLLRTLAIAAHTYSGPRWDSVKLLVVGGSFAEAEWIHGLGPLLPDDCMVYHHLSASESARHFQWTAPLKEVPRTGRLPIGMPRNSENVRLEPLADTDSCFSVLVSGVIARGYLHADDTSTRWSTDENGVVWWESGDIVRWDEGISAYLHEGRADDLVKVGGYLVALGDVQRAIIDDTQVEDAAVTSHTVDQKVHLVAHVSGGTGSDINLSALRTHLTSVLPRWSVPTVYLTYESLPVTPREKVDFVALRQRAEKHLVTLRDHSHPETKHHG